MSLVLLVVWGGLLEGVAWYATQDTTYTEFLESFTQAAGILHGLAAVVISFWFISAWAAKEPTAYHLTLFLVVVAVSVAAPVTVFYRAPGAWNDGAAWRALLLMLPNIVTVSAYFLKIPKKKS